tara:strand:+ start:73 stop:447 length:375 start_codon:yes stop_codon:yes gene_type:complete
MKLLKSFIYYFLTSGLFVALTLVLLDAISYKFNFVNFFAFASASFFLINLMQYNVVNNSNPYAKRGFVIHTLFGIALWVLLAILLYFLNEFKYNIIEINSIILSTFLIGFIIYFIAYYYGYLNF